MRNLFIAAGAVIIYSAWANNTTVMKEETITILQTANKPGALSVRNWM